MTTDPPRRIAGLDGMRGLAAIAVVVCHVGQRASPDGPASPVTEYLMLGSNGLTVFFVLSGFLLYRPFVRARLTGGRGPRIRTYLLARALRIVPAHVVVFLAAAAAGVLIVANPTGLFDDTRLLGHPQDLGTTLLDLLLLQTAWPTTIATGIPPEWSLGAEAAFYLALPLLAAIGGRVRGRLRGLTPALALIGVGIGTTAVLTLQILQHHTQGYELEWGSTWNAVLARSFPAQGALFGMGMAAAWLVERHALRGPSPTRLITPGATALAGSVLIVTGAVDIEFIGQPAVALGTALLLVTIALPATDGRPGTLARTLDRRPLRRLGEISYGVYLLHFPVIMWLKAHGLTLGGTTGLLLDVGIVLLVVLPLAALLHVAIERPALRLRAGLRSAAGHGLRPSSPRDRRRVGTAVDRST